MPAGETEHRPWGRFTVLADEADHKVKRIVIRPGGRLSLQRHARRAEHWRAVSGRAVVSLGEEEFTLSAGQGADVPRGAWHRARNDEDAPFVFIEVQTGDYFAEDDIERREDDYGRV